MIQQSAKKKKMPKMKRKAVATYPHKQSKSTYKGK